jgi:enolase
VDERCDRVTPCDGDSRLARESRAESFSRAPERHLGERVSSFRRFDGHARGFELRDGDPNRYGGRGLLRAVSNVTNIIGPELISLDATRQQDIDKILIDLDGTKDKSCLGANAILGVSMALARAAAKAIGQPLYSYLRAGERPRLAVPMMNVINGGAHADNSLDFQEFMLVPHGAPTFAEAIRYGAEVFQALKALLSKLGHVTNVGDEGGFAPKLEHNEDACNLILDVLHRRVGLRHIDMPATPSRVWETLNSQGKRIPC